MCNISSGENDDSAKAGELKGEHMKIECNIIQDLLPLYVEQLVSEKSKMEIKEHLKECNQCRKIYKEMNMPEPHIQYSIEPAESFRKYVKKKKTKWGIKIAAITVLVVCTVVMLRLIAIGGLFAFLALDIANSEIFRDTDVSHYSLYMGEDAQEEYVNKWGMNESIFPKEITNEMRVTDYKMVYYNPWDAQYLSYLVVEYEAEDYQTEAERLKNYVSTDYLGYYGSESFMEGYKLLAMEADPYYGFVYALEIGENKIVYVELIFCNYFMDLDYESMIPKEYLPVGFDATKDNLYRKQKLKE